MAGINMDRDFHAFTKAWIDNHQYVGIPVQSLNAVLVATEHVADNDTQGTQGLLEVDCSFGYFQVYGYYNSSNDTFYCSSAYLVVPKFGRIPMISDVAFKLNHSDAVEVNLGKAANGTIKIEYYGANKELVAFNYNLNIAFVGKGQDTIGLFPVKPTATTKKYPRKTSDVGAIRRSLEAKVVKRLALSTSSGSGNIRGRTQEERAQVDLLDTFLNDFLRDDGNLNQGTKVIAVETYYPENVNKGPGGVGASESYTASYNFSILEVAVTVNPSTLSLAAGLFMKVPIAGRVNIINISGSLLDGQRIHARIDVYVATGDVALYAKKKDDDDDNLYISFTLDISLFGRITQSDFFLATLP